MTQGAQNKTEEIEDLDVLVASRSLKPGKVRLFGRTWTIKRDFAPAEMAQFWVHVDSGRNAEAMKMLVGAKDGADMAQLVTAMPTELLTQPMRRIYQIAGLLRRPNDDEAAEGESTAS
jgi:hypothetical protein